MNKELEKAKKLMAMALQHEGKPSFADKLAEGDVDWESLFNVWNDEPEDENFSKLLGFVETYLKENVDPVEIEKNGKIPYQILLTLSKMLLGTKIPKHYGGLELGTLHYCRLMKILSSCHPSLGIWYTANCSIGLSGYLMVVYHTLDKEVDDLELRLKKTKNEKQKEKLNIRCKETKEALFRTKNQMNMFFSNMARGSNAGFGLTQITAGSDPMSMIGTDTVAERIDKDSIHLKGHKLYNTNAAIAEYEVIMAPLLPENKMCAFIVPTKYYGKFEVVPCDFAGNRGIENGLIVFDVIIPSIFMVGKVGDGLKNALRTLNVGRLAMAAGSSASVIQCLQISRWWSKVRVQDLPIGKYKQIAIKVSKMACNVFAIEALMKLGATIYDKFKSEQDLRLMTAAIKLWSTEAAFSSAVHESEIRSGHGYETYESQLRRSKHILPHEIPLPDERFIDDIRVLLIGEGTSDIQKLIIFGVMAAPHLARFVPVVDSSLSYSKRFISFLKLSLYVPWVWFRLIKMFLCFYDFERFVHPKIYKHVIYINFQSQKLALKLLFNLMWHRTKLLKENKVTGFMAKQLTELWVMSAVCCSAANLYKKQGDIVLEIADIFCRYARYRIKGIDDDTPKPKADKKAYALAQKIIFSKTWEESPISFLEKGVVSILERELKRHGNDNSYK